MALGRQADIQWAATGRTFTFDCRGRWVVPGFVDAHIHIRAAASVGAAIDLSYVRSREVLLSNLKDTAASAPPGWLSFAGLQLDDVPTVAELDASAPHHLVRIRHRSLHAWLLNSSASGKAGVPPSDGWVPDAVGRISARLGRVTEAASFERILAEWSHARLSEGVTSVVDATATNGLTQIGQLGEWYDRQVLLQMPAAFSSSPVGQQTGGPPVLAVKVLVPNGDNLAQELESQIRTAWSAGFVAAVHCPDLETLAVLLEILERAGDNRGRVRIEHASVCPDQWVHRVAKMRASVVTHPAFIHTHGDRYLGDASLAPHDWLYRLASWQKAGVPVAVGSDAPAGPADPLLAWRASISRRTASGQLLGPDESLTPIDALAAITAWAADVSGLPDAGRLHIGARAAAVVLEGDPFTLDLDADVRAAAVVNDGVLMVEPSDA
jgi:predicted amidohydrolase YtcJ